MRPNSYGFCSLRMASIAFFVLVAAALPARAETLTVRLTSEPETLDWNRAHTPIENFLLMNMMEGLVELDHQLKVRPALATTWKISGDGLTYTFTLRKGVKWSDGVLLKAGDFVTSWKRLLDPSTGASYAYFLFDVVGAEAYTQGRTKDFSTVGIRAIDDSRLEVKLTKPVAHWILVPSFWVTYPMREDLLAKHGSSWTRPGKLVSVGPYRLKTHDMESKIVLEANPTYWGKRANVDQIVGLVVRDDSTAMNLFETGKIDFLTDLSTLDLKRYAGKPELKIFPYLKTGYLGMMTDRAPTSNLHLRKAIAQAVDRAPLAKLLYGEQRPATSWVPEKLQGHSTTLGLRYDLKAARHELDQAKKELGALPPVSLLLPTGEKQLTLGQYLQSQLKQNLGLEVTLEPYDHKTFRANIKAGTSPLFLLSWSADYPDADNYLSVFLSIAGNNWPHFKNAKYDELTLRARGETRASVREKLQLEAQRILLNEQSVVLPLYYEPNPALIKAKLKNFVINPLNNLLVREVSIGQ